ncbi:protein RRP5 homolog isoform X2 [Toxorhynchites rutilus septentrionalis]|uniref:protein RRP5 homolog isoform X2 n=1 Tax=Toxorhynchites rutilus septentrionalis TaxID=329112 RepID=UPI0024791893|nr:protein RRP5 homolog isoform X2 [Toxorhynchites rutilus septentrionalis]
MVYIEPSFPRGRKAEDSEDNKPRKRLKKNADYGASTTTEERSQKPRQKERQQSRIEQMEQDKDDLEQSIKAANLHFRTACEGMLVFGCVYKIQQMELIISLPGRLFGSVPLRSISNAYSNRLQSLLHSSTTTGEERCPGLGELYSVGDLVYVKIKTKNEKDRKLELTLDPSELHSEFNHKHLVEGLILSATIEEEEDHGYQMDVGMKNVRAFLPAQSLNKNKTEVGSNIYCAVEKITKAKGCATIILRAFKPTEPRKLEIAKPNIDALVPGSVVTFSVESTLKNGLQGTLFDDTVPAFVNENMLERPLSKLQNYESKLLQARILYVMPMTKHVFLTLANYDGNKATVGDPVAPGTIVEDAKIIHKCSNGIWFQLGKKHKGLLPRYILKEKYSQNYDEQIVMAKYQLNSVHKVRAIRFDAFDRTTIVTDEEKLIESKFFTLNDVKVGEMYDCRVTSILSSNRGYLVKLDQIKGLVSSHNFGQHKSVAVNQTVRLRLIAIDEDRKMAQFSNHPEYLKKSVKLITSREHIEVGQSYHGTVISEKDKFFVVAFCNKITGILFKFCRDVAQDQDKIARLKLGVVDRFTVHNMSEDGERITISIPLTAGSTNLGHTATATITGVFATGADVYLVKENETGTLPTDMFSDFPEHNAVFVNVVKEGEQLPVVNLRENVFSRRDVEYFKRRPTLVKDVKCGHILRAYCVGSEKGKFSLQLALKDYPTRVVLPLAMVSARKSLLTLDDGQVILVKVTKLVQKPTGVLLIVSPKMQDVCVHGVDEVLRYVQRYVTEVNGLIRRFISRGKSFAQYTVGQTVMCEVDSLVDDSDQMIVRLCQSGSDFDGEQTKAIAAKDPKKDDYAVGDELLGRIVWVDIEKQLVHVCVVKKLLKNIINGDLKADIPSELFDVDVKRDFVILFSNRYIAIGCLRKVDCPLVAVPVKCHYNDFDPIDVQQTAKVVLIRQHEELVYGMFEESYDKFKELKFVKKDESEIKKGKNCWLPDNFEEPEDEIGSEEEPQESSDANEENDSEGNEQSDSGIDKDDEKPPKKAKKKQKKLIEVEKIAAALPEKNLKDKKQKKKAMTMKLEDSNSTDKTTEEIQSPVNTTKKSKKKQKGKASKEPKVPKLTGTNAVASPGKALKVKQKKKKAVEKKLKGAKSFVISQLDGADDFVALKKKGKNKQRKHFLSERPTAKAPDLVGSKQSGCGKGAHEHTNKFEKKDTLQQVAKQTKFKSKPNKKIKIDAESANDAVRELAKDSKTRHKDVALPGAESFWSVATSAQIRKQESDSSDDDDQPEESVKKRLTAKERFDAMKQEEERIRKIEEELADASVDPHTPDQFDRLVLAQPNSSLLWIRYMVFHMESAEIEKARGVARRALKTINYREEAERLNVWIALLNLELRYETIEKFKEVLLEAIQCNDDYKVYSRVIEILIDCGKVPEVLEMIETLQKKFRKQPEMWLLVATCYYKIGHRSNVKPLLSKALKSLENKEHIPLILKFAFLHNRNDERDEAHILFEQILSSYPKRTDVWSQYVDLLVKDGLLDAARQTLDRAIVQRLPMRNMKTLYTKYVNFEEKHGDRESVRKIKQMAADYVKQQLSANGVAANSAAVNDE